MDLPHIGLGTYRMKSKEQMTGIVHDAIQIGYRLFDTAQVYGNEAMLGEAIATADIAREELFITTKVSPKFMTSEMAVYESVLQSLTNLRLQYIDLVLIHWPGTAKRDIRISNSENRRSAWLALERLIVEKKARFIGVSNYTPMHLQELLAFAKTPPYCNQVEFHPLYIPLKTWEYCKSVGIHVQAYSSLGEGNLLDTNSTQFGVFDEIADKYSCTRAQLLLRWAIQHGVGVVPKSSSKSRLQENFNITWFEISSQDMHRLDSLTVNGELTQKKFCWDPSFVA